MLRPILGEAESSTLTKKAEDGAPRVRTIAPMGAPPAPPPPPPPPQSAREILRLEATQLPSYRRFVSKHILPDEHARHEFVQESLKFGALADQLDAANGNQGRHGVAATPAAAAAAALAESSPSVAPPYLLSADGALGEAWRPSALATATTPDEEAIDLPPRYALLLRGVASLLDDTPYSLHRFVLRLEALLFGKVSREGVLSASGVPCAHCGDVPPTSTLLCTQCERGLRDCGCEEPVPLCEACNLAGVARAYRRAATTRARCGRPSRCGATRALASTGHARGRRCRRTRRWRSARHVSQTTAPIACALCTRTPSSPLPPTRRQTRLHDAAEGTVVNEEELRIGHLPGCKGKREAEKPSSSRLAVRGRRLTAAEHEKLDALSHTEAFALERRNSRASEVRTPADWVAKQGMRACAMKRPREDPGWVRCVLPAIPSQQLPAKVSYLPPHGLQRYKRPPPKVKRDVVEEEPGAVGVEPDDEEDDGAAAAAAAAQSSGQIRRRGGPPQRGRRGQGRADLGAARRVSVEGEATRLATSSSCRIAILSMFSKF